MIKKALKYIPFCLFRVRASNSEEVGKTRRRAWSKHDTNSIARRLPTPAAKRMLNIFVEPLINLNDASSFFNQIFVCVLLKNNSLPTTNHRFIALQIVHSQSVGYATCHSPVSLLLHILKIGW
jgi:hypothetical protein